MVEAERDGVRGGGGLGLIGIGIGLDDDVGDSDIDLLRSSPPAPALESLVSVVVVHIPAGNDNGESDAEVIVITDRYSTNAHWWWDGEPSHVSCPWSTMTTTTMMMNVLW